MAEDKEDLVGLTVEQKAEVTAAKVAAAKAEATKNLAEARKLEFEALEAESKAKQATLGLETAEISMKKAREAEEKRLLGNEYLHIYNFDSSVSEGTVKSAVETLEMWSRMCPNCDITVKFFSPGGDVISGMAFFDYLMSLRKRGHKVTTIAEGYAASMAGILLQAGDVRQCGAESYILIHEISTAVRGKVGEIEDEMIFIKKISERVLDIFSDRAAEARVNGTASKALSKRQFRDRWSRRDWWMTSQEALDYGVIDEVVP